MSDALQLGWRAPGAKAATSRRTTDGLQLDASGRATTNTRRCPPTPEGVRGAIGWLDVSGEETVTSIGQPGSATGGPGLAILRPEG